jgi:hypothetical protein
LGDGLVIERLPGQLLDLLMSLGQTLATHVSPHFLRVGADRRPAAVVVFSSAATRSAGEVTSSARPKLLMQTSQPGNGAMALST